MIRFNGIPDSLTIGAIYQYTLRYFTNRFDYSLRDCLPTKFTITDRTVYAKNKEGKYSSPNELITCQSYSYPQYPPYIYVKGKKSNKQRKIRHQYKIFIAIQPTADNKYSFYDSKIIWRVGSYSKWNFHPSQSMVKTVYSDTRQRIVKKAEKKFKTTQEQQKYIKEEIQKIKNKGKYLDVGDYNSQEKGLNGDNFFRSQPIQYKFNCLYGPCANKDIPQNILMPFFCKHMICSLSVLLRKGIIKVL